MKNFTTIAKEFLSTTKKEYTAEDVRLLAEDIQNQYYDYLQVVDEFWQSHIGWRDFIEDLLDKGAPSELMYLVHDIRHKEEGDIVRMMRDAKDDLRKRCPMVFS